MRPSAIWSSIARAGTLAGSGADLLHAARSPEQMESVAAIMRDGDLKIGTRTFGGGLSGSFQSYWATQAGQGVEVLSKTAAQGAAQEVFAYRVARALGIAHLFPVVIPCAGGSALMEVVGGSTLRQLGVRNWKELECTLTDGYLLREPDMSTKEAARRARVDRQLVQVFDYIVGNNDRHPSNLMYDPAAGVMRLIDNVLVGSGMPDMPMADKTYIHHAPKTFSLFRMTRLRLEPEVIEVLRAADRDAIVRAATDLAKTTAHDQSASLGWRIGVEFAHDVGRRFDRASRGRALHVELI
jgi:hypothetical protein